MNTRQHIIDTYRKRAKNYDFTANLYYLIGYPEWKYRRLTVEALQLREGDTVVEIACGTGLNFDLYQDRIGPQGHIIGVDLTDAMLEQAHQRVQNEGWENVTLINQDALTFDFPSGVDAVVSTFAISLIPEAPAIIERAAQSLVPHGRMVITDFKFPPEWPDWLIKVGMALVEPFGATQEWVERKLWVGIKAARRTTLSSVAMKQYYFGTTYIISGEAAS